MCFFQKMIPGNNEDLVLSSKCENSDFSVSKEHLLFSFIPSKQILYFTRFHGCLVSYLMTIHTLLSRRNMELLFKVKKFKSLVGICLDNWG